MTPSSALGELEADLAFLRELLPPTPEIAWPLLAARCGADVVVKHENHSPIGAFKLRGGLVYMHELRAREPKLAGVITATRGNHGQSVAFAARRAGFAATIAVPHGNSLEKNAAMRALGARLVEHGRDFQDALLHAQALAKSQDLHFVPSFHPWLVRGVSTCALELLRARPDLDVLYVPIGLGSGVCGALRARDALGLRTRIVGVVAENAPTYALSFAAGRVVPTDSADTLADGLAVRVPNADALAAICAGAERIVRVSEAEIRAAMRALFSDTHNVAEGAGAAALAACLQERAAVAGKRVGLVLTGGNVDRAAYAAVLAENEPS
ncbi:MAG TPA: threonine dehydratase [Myxococcota bacterium]|nr:threonine dehydratase [Myxococcota bacterium]